MPALDTIALSGTDLETTRLGFGCARLFRLPTRRGRQALLHAAHDAGIRHFDVARMYGLGAAEGELGRFARGRRDELVLATKFGIEPGSSSGLVVRLQGPVRWLNTKVPALRRRLRASSGALYEPRRYDAESARRSLETSLGELGVDHVDLLFLHEPEPRDDVRADEVRSFLEDARARGLVRAWGVSGEPGPSAEVARALGAGLLLQVHDDVLLREGAPAGPLTFGALSSALPRIAGHVAADETRRARWREETGVDCGEPTALAPLLLADALAANPQGTVVFSDTRAERIAPAVERAATGAGDVAALRRLVAAELRA